MMKKQQGPAFRRELRFIVECNICVGKGMRQGIFHCLECDHCLGSGWVCGHTLQTLPLSEIVPVLNARLKEALGSIANARQVIGGAQQQYEQNNRRGAGGSNYTGD